MVVMNPFLDGNGMQTRLLDAAKMATRSRQKTTLPSNCRATYCRALTRNLRRCAPAVGWTKVGWTKKVGVDQKSAGVKRVARCQWHVIFEAKSSRLAASGVQAATCDVHHGGRSGPDRII